MSHKRPLITLQNCRKNDIIITTNGDKCCVLMKEGKLIHRSKWWEYESFSEIITVSDAGKAGWKVMQEHGQIPMTIQEAEMFIYQLGGKFVKII